MRDWAELDAAAALEFLRKNFPAKLMAIGHSFGGQSFALIPEPSGSRQRSRSARRSGYWRHWRGASRAGMWLLTHALLPGISRLFGYFPAAALGQGENIPAGVAIDVRWCRIATTSSRPGRKKSGSALQRAASPLLGSPHDRYDAARGRRSPASSTARPSELTRVMPRELGAERIGHFGFFREQFRVLWRDRCRTGWRGTE